MTRKRWIWTAGLGALALGLGLGAWSLRNDLGYARIAAGYAAKQTCSCLHVSGRSLESCVSDFPDDAREQISLAQDGATVRASVLFGSIKASARYEEGFGCSALD